MISEAPTAADFSQVRVRSLIVWLLLGGLLIAIVMAVAMAANLGPAWYPLLFNSVQYALFLVWSMRQCTSAGTDLTQLLRPQPSPQDWKAVMALFPLYPLLSGLLLVQVLLSSLIWPVSDIRDDAFVGHSGLWFFTCAAACTIVPFVEEIVFRGLIFRRWACKWGINRALFASSILFGLMHGSNFVFATTLGLFFALLYLRSGSLWLPIAAHSLWNFQAYFLPWQLWSFGTWPLGVAYFFGGALFLWLMRDVYMPRLPLTLAPLPRFFSVKP